MQNDGWRKLLALQLSTQLPPKPEDARVVIDYLSEILTKFIARPYDEGPTATVLSLVSEQPEAPSQLNGKAV